MEAEETKKAADNESRADKFVRLGEYRVNKVIDAIGRLENLSNRSNMSTHRSRWKPCFP